MKERSRIFICLKRRNKILIRDATSSDLPRLFEIEAACQAFPWTETILADCLRVHYPTWIIEQEGIVCAFLIVQPILDECHILNLAVDPVYQRRGFASALLAHLFKTIKAERFLLEVRVSNTAAIELYKKLGFIELSRRKDYYPTAQGREDAIVLSISF